MGAGAYKVAKEKINILQGIFCLPISSRQSRKKRDDESDEGSGAHEKKIYEYMA